MNSQNPQESTLWKDITDVEAAQVVGGYTGQPAFIGVPSKKPDGVIPSGPVLASGEAIIQIYAGEQKGASDVIHYYPLPIEIIDAPL